MVVVIIIFVIIDFIYIYIHTHTLYIQNAIVKLCSKGAINSKIYKIRNCMRNHSVTKMITM
jgi:hypothetical protein